jgi:branched-chain amino acid transport system substrate-binding protein
VRGPNFRLKENHFPVQSYYLVQVEKDAKGRYVSALRQTIMTDLTDAYAGDCKMPAP